MTALAPALCSVTFRQLAPEEIVALAERARLAAIEWGGDVHVPLGDLAAARRVRGLTQAAGLAPASYGSYLYPPDHGLDDFSRALDTCRALGATNIRLWPGRRGRPSAEYDEAERRDAAGMIRAMGAMAETAGVTVSLEYHPHSLTDATISAERLMSEIASGNVFLYWQPRPGQPLAEALDEIGRVGPLVSHVHVFAWDGERRRYPLADQAGWWAAALGALPPSRFPGPRYAMIEFVEGDDPQRFLADAAVLGGLLQQGRG